jgi:hypothetical protein
MRVPERPGLFALASELRFSAQHPSEISDNVLYSTVAVGHESFDRPITPPSSDLKGEAIPWVPKE